MWRINEKNNAKEIGFSRITFLKCMLWSYFGILKR